MCVHFFPRIVIWSSVSWLEDITGHLYSCMTYYHAESFLFQNFIWPILDLTLETESSPVHWSFAKEEMPESHLILHIHFKIIQNRHSLAFGILVLTLISSNYFFHIDKYLKKENGYFNLREDTFQRLSSLYLSMEEYLIIIIECLFRLYNLKQVFREASLMAKTFLCVVVIFFPSKTHTHTLSLSSLPERKT